jgi:hypothetical protein
MRNTTAAYGQANEGQHKHDQPQNVPLSMDITREANPHTRNDCMDVMYMDTARWPRVTAHVTAPTTTPTINDFDAARPYR